jgi:hypothetical protein
LVEVCPWNLVQQSENFTSNWNPNSNTITANTTTAPNGTTTADTFTLIPSSDSSVYQAVNGESNNYTTSVYAKYVSGDKYLYFFSQLNSQGAKVWFDIQNGTVSNQISGFTGTIENVGNGWYKCSMYNTTASVSDYIQFGISTTNSSRTLSNNSVAYFWGAQVNVGTAKPYFPTTDRLNVPRLTYQNGGGGCPSLLLEKQSTNYVKYSQDFTQSDWTQSGATITANAIISPDGTQNATRVQFSAGSRYVYQTIGGSGIAAGSVTISCWIKGASVQKIGFSDGNANPNEITLTTDWQRYTFTFTYSSGGIGVQFDNYFGVTPSAQTKDFYIWGAQSEQSTYPTSYIPTTSASATRVADACSKTGISSLIGQTSGTVFVDAYIDNIEASANNILFYLAGTGVDKYVLITSSGGVRYIDFPNGNITNNSYGLTNGRHKFAIAYANNDFAFYIDGNLIGTDTSGTPSACSEFGFFYYASGYDFPLKVNEAVLFKTRLTNAELASLTTI